MTPFNGITVVYADNVYGHKVFRATGDLGFKVIITEEPFRETPQSQRIKWCEEMAERLLNYENAAILTNDYYFIRMMEFIVPEDEFQIYHLDTGETVKKFVDLKPNPTLKNGEYVFGVSVKSALKR